MIVPDRKKQRKIHSRMINTVIYEGKTDTIIAEGELLDRRYCDSYRPDGEIRPPHPVHNMILRMELHLPELTIMDLEVEMPTTPNEACMEIQDSLAPLVGMRIAAGFNAKVRKRIDRVKTCTHLQTLVAAMASASFQGAWSAMVRSPLELKTYKAMTSRLKDTCWAWRDGGPLIKKIKRTD